MKGKKVRLGNTQYSVETDSRDKTVSIDFIETEWDEGSRSMRVDDINENFTASDFVAVLEKEFPDFRKNKVTFYVHSGRGVQLTQKLT